MSDYTGGKQISVFLRYFVWLCLSYSNVVQTAQASNQSEQYVFVVCWLSGFCTGTKEAKFLVVTKMLLQYAHSDSWNIGTKATCLLTSNALWGAVEVDESLTPASVVACSTCVSFWDPNWCGLTDLSVAIQAFWYLASIVSVPVGFALPFGIPFGDKQGEL